MKQAYLLFTSALIFISAFTASHTTRSSFSSTAANTNNSFSSSAASPSTPATPPLPSSTTATPQPGDIVINEVSPEGNSKDEWVELFNRTSSTINVSGWSIGDKNNDDTLPSALPIPPHGYAVIVTSNTTVSGLPSSAITITLIGTGSTDIGSGLNNPGDSVILKNSSSVIIDQMSYGDVSSPVFTDPPAKPSDSSHTLSRHPNGVDTDTSADWITNATPSAGLPNL